MSNKEYLFQITTSYACAGIVCNADGVVIEAAPIFRWMVGKHFRTVERWKKITSIKRVT